ncbi:hypothetical protein [Micromonospora zamorensis]|uniref:hypothetical protein n=1 Tax=Micromonospora zamorensis TaxID=709883 RepID=UPI0033C57863
MPWHPRHQDESRAILTSSTTSAANRQVQRLGAAVVRTDLVDLIGRVDGSPSDQQIAAWLAQLTDKEVLDRMSRLKAPPVASRPATVPTLDVTRQPGTPTCTNALSERHCALTALTP